MRTRSSFGILLLYILTNKELLLRISIEREKQRGGRESLRCNTQSKKRNRISKRNQRWKVPHGTDSREIRRIHFIS